MGLVKGDSVTMKKSFLSFYGPKLFVVLLVKCTEMEEKLFNYLNNINNTIMNIVYLPVTYCKMLVELLVSLHVCHYSHC